MLLHSAVNNTKDIVPSGAQNPAGVFSLHASSVMVLTVIMLWIAGRLLPDRMSKPKK